MTPAIHVLRIGAVVCALAVPTLAVDRWVSSAEVSLEKERAIAQADDTPTASMADVGYCSPSLKKILRRVLTACGLIGGDNARGCQPIQAKNVATMQGSDFNALFEPMQERGAIIEFEQGKSELGPEDATVIDDVFRTRRGASYFFVVSRASPDGSADRNRELSQERADAVMTHLRQTFNDPDLESEVGLLWLGEEYAQLEEKFCDWRRSGDPTSCTADDINRSAFIAWIDCTL